MGAGLMPLHEWTVGETRLPLYLLLSAVALVLLIACANVASLLLVRARDRSREISIRAALGAGRARILRQMLTESALLSLIGGALGTLLGVWGTRGLVALAPHTIPRLDEVRPDGALFLFSLSVSLLTGFLFGLIPALSGSRPDLNETLKEGARAGTLGARSLRAGHFLVVAEMALAVILLVGAALLTRSFLLLKQVDPGFNAQNVLSVEVALPRARYPEEHRVVAFFSSVIDRIRALPGVEATSATTRLPLLRRGWSSDFSVEGRPPDAFGIDVLHSEVGPDYFETLRVPILKGRFFGEGDVASSPAVVLINEALARQYFVGEDPLGRKLCFDRNPDARSVWRTIVGVVGDVRQTGLRAEPRPEIFAPFAQDFSSRMTVVVRTAAEPRSYVGAVRAQVQVLDRDLAIFSIRTLDDVRFEVLAQERFLLTLLAVFAAVAMLLATVGVYGVVSHTARRRTREIGIRMALGARAADVIRVVVGQGLGLALLGLAAGVLGALALTQLLGTLLFEVRPTDPASFVLVAFVLTGAAGLACYLPARRATRTDPAEVLRCE